jgi:hypothetical protein
MPSNMFLINLISSPASLSPLSSLVTLICIYKSYIRRSLVNTYLTHIHICTVLPYIPISTYIVRGLKFSNKFDSSKMTSFALTMW